MLAGKRCLDGNPSSDLHFGTSRENYSGLIDFAADFSLSSAEHGNWADITRRGIGMDLRDFAWA
jgi:hypothetical protein